MIRSEFFENLSNLYSGFKEKDSDIFDEILMLYNGAELDTIWKSIYYDSFTYKPRPCDIKNRADSIGIVKSFSIDDGKFYYRCLKCNLKISIESYGCPNCKQIFDHKNSIMVKCAELPTGLKYMNSHCNIKTCETFLKDENNSFGFKCIDFGEKNNFKYCAVCNCKACCHDEKRRKFDS